MITNICLLLEIMSIVLCLHRLYGEKFNLDIITTSFLTIYMIIMTAINYYELPEIYTMVIYPVLFVYCGIRFSFCIKEILINSVLCISITGGAQVIMLMLFYFIFNINYFVNLYLLIINCLSLILVVAFISKFKVDKLSNYMQRRDVILQIALVMCIAVSVFCVVEYKKIEWIGLYQYVLLFISVVFICILVGQLGKYKMKSKEIETELKTHQLYEDSFHGLIEDIRLKQHEFDNHINTINSLHYMCDTYDELVNKQKEYGEIVIKENQFNKLLKKGNPLVIGFLYGKFVEIDKFGIEIIYFINFENLNVGIPTYKIVEILGNLIKNAVEAINVSNEFKVLYVEIIEIDGEFKIEVRNKSKFIQQEKLEAFFRKGYSQKGEGRGIGLYNVKNVCMEYSLNILCENKVIDGENWLSLR